MDKISYIKIHFSSSKICLKIRQKYARVTKTRVPHMPCFVQSFFFFQQFGANIWQYITYYFSNFVKIKIKYFLLYFIVFEFYIQTFSIIHVCPILCFSRIIWMFYPFFFQKYSFLFCKVCQKRK